MTYKTKEILVNCLIALLIFTLCRLLFIAFNSYYVIGNSFTDVVFALIHGVRFDASYLAYALSLYLTIAFFPIAIPNSDRFLKYVFLICIGISIIPNIIDLEYIVFSARRLTSEVLAMEGDIRNQSTQLISNFWHLFLILVALIYLAFKLYRPLSMREKKLKSSIPRFFVYALILVLCIRGGFQHRPLSIFHALDSHNENLAIVSLNSSFSFIHSFKLKKLQKYNFYSTDEEALRVIHKYSKATPQHKITKDNIVLILLESFATEYTGIEDSISYTPFLDSLSKEGLYYKNFYANGRRSLDALPPLLCGLPNLIDKSLIYSNYEGNKVYGVPQVLVDNGYSTNFFHGGENGTFRFDLMSRKAGIQNYFGMNEYPDPSHFDGAWGIYDHLYLSYVADQIKELKPPFFNLIFTLSSHNPYKIPADFESQFPKGNLKIHQSIGYSDYSLQQFFKKIKKEDWYDSTLFILTADHSQQSIDKKYTSYTGWYDIPLVLFHPSKTLTKNNVNGFYQHKDIPKTILNHIGINSDNFIYSKSLLDEDQNNYCLLYENKTYRIYNGQYTVKFKDNEFSYYAFTDNFEQKPISRNGQVKELEDLLKAIIQVYNNQMINNQLITKKPS